MTNFIAKVIMDGYGLDSRKLVTALELCLLVVRNLPYSLVVWGQIVKVGRARMLIVYDVVDTMQPLDFSRFSKRSR